MKTKFRSECHRASRIARRCVALWLALLLVVALAGCAAPAAPTDPADGQTGAVDGSTPEGLAPEGDTSKDTASAGDPAATDADLPAEGVQPPLTFTDAQGYEVTLQSWQTVVSLYGSFAETWLLAGGELAGVTSDAQQERQLALGEDVAIVGTVKEPNLEEILAVQPDFLILSADIAAQVKMHDALAEAQIPHAYYRVDTFDEYLAMLEQFCQMTGRQDLYQQNGLAVQQQIDDVLAAVEGQTAPTVLLLRTFATGAKAKGDDNLAGVILRDLGADNLVTRHESLLEDLSIEEIIEADPDYIFITVMGASEASGLAYLADTLEANPAWPQLSAVQNDRYILLPKELFHYKPNARWGESYAYLAKILYPQLADQIK